MSTFLGRVGGAAARHPWRTVVAWLVLLVALFGLKTAFGAQTHDNYDVPGTQSQAGAEFLQAHFPQMSGTNARVVIHDTAGHHVDPTVLGMVSHNLSRMPGAAVVDPPVLSKDGATALIDVQYKVPVTDFSGNSGVDTLTAATAPAKADGLQVALGGQVPESVIAVNGAADAIGVLVALIVLVLALRSLIAAGLPLLVGIAGLGAGTAVIGLLCALTDISPTAPTVAEMLGLGVGIDYALLLVARHVEGLRSGLSPHAAAARAASTAGTSVVIAGLTVLVSLFGLGLSTLQTYSSFSYATFATVIFVMLAALTLVPALCALAGRRILPRRDRHGQHDQHDHSDLPERPTRTERWATWVTRRPLPAALAATAILLALAAPALGMRTWPDDAGTMPASNTARQAYDLVTAEFGPGANGPLLVAVDTAKVHQPAALAAQYRALPGVASVSAPVTDASGDAAVITVVPTTKPSDQATQDLLHRIRASAPSGVLVTGTEAAYADVTQRLADKLWVVIAFVVAVSLIILTGLLRAPVNALKAAVLNLLSVAAAFGVVTAIFQTDFGAHLVGVPHAAPVSTWVPILMFTALFGLSMDYEVFLLSRVREAWLRTGDAKAAVVQGVSATGRVITSAAAIMIAVFLGFAMDPNVTVKTVGVGMAAAVLIDATLVRLILAPAAMTLLGKAGWWLPRSLARRQPSRPAANPASSGEQELRPQPADEVTADR
ncbi:MAG TPA: MMPL family transporter [Trebonia sp.]|nr:MMPL family transporter [Trebonia sp.]